MNWLDKLGARRQRRQEILRDLRENGWRSVRRELMNRAEKIQRVVAQVPSKAMESGKATARKIISIQKAARLGEKLVAQSARSVVYDTQHDSPGHRHWIEGYAAEVRERLAGILPEAPKSREWFEIDPHGPDKEDIELEA